MRLYVYASLVYAIGSVAADTQPVLSQSSTGVAVLTASAIEIRDQEPARKSVESDGLSARFSVDLANVPLRLALDAVIVKSGVQVLYSSVLPLERRVSVQGKNVMVRDALDQVLKGLPFHAILSPEGQVVIVRNGSAASAQVAHGVIAGKVINGKTKQPIVGATITLHGETQGVVTDNSGTFRLSVEAGDRRITVRAIGMAKQDKMVTVTQDNTTTVEIVLEPSASVLDEVVVTGTVVATARKAIPTPITVVTAADIEKRGITRIEQLFRGEIPGLMAIDAGTRSFSEIQGLGTMVSSKVYSRGASSIDGGANPIKTYVDGVELADPSFLGTIDPKSIERIEIVTGPQAATIYGSGALGGVMQIFTKKGSGKNSPDLTLNVKYGMLENNLSSNRTPAHSDALLINGGTGPEFSYAGNLSYNYTGQWQPNLFVRSYGAQVGVTHARGPFSATANASQTMTTNGLSGNGGIGGGSLIEKTYRLTGEWVPNFLVMRFDTKRISKSTGQIISLGLDYRPFASWQHHLTVGKTQNQFDFIPQAPGASSTGDTLYIVDHRATQRSTANYNMTLLSPRVGPLSSTLTLGGSGSRSSGITTWGCKATKVSTAFVGCSSGSAPGVSQQEDDETYGGFGSWQLGIANQLFITVGLRGEHNPRYGQSHAIDWTPTNGITYTAEFGVTTIKFLASYGRATRAPQMSQRHEATYTNPNTTPSSYVSQIANLTLRPEYERGPQGGVEIYYGNMGSVTVNRYRQKITDLIIWYYVDSIPAVNNNTGAATYLKQSQYGNLNEMAKQGWEGTAALSLGHVSIKGAYSWNDSRVTYVDPKYPYASSYAIGSVFDNIPSHFGSVSIGYAMNRTSVNLVSNFIGASSSIVGYDIRTGDGGGLYKRLPMYVDRSSRMSAMRIPRSMKSDLAASQRINDMVSTTLNVTNLTNQFNSDIGTLYPTLGRQTQLGVSMRFPR